MGPDGHGHHPRRYPVGVFTATESAAVAVVWSFFVTMFIYRDYKWRDLPKLMHRTVRTISIVMILIGFAASFGYVMTLMQIPSKITTAFLTLSDNRYVILMCINFMLLLLGTVMDMAPLILILTPILLPVITGIGVDPVHFGMIMLVNLGIGLITPPVGAVLFVGSAIGKVSIESTVKALLPFYLALFLVLMAVTYIPAISLWLPSVVLYLTGAAWRPLGSCNGSCTWLSPPRLYRFSPANWPSPCSPCWPVHSPATTSPRASPSMTAPACCWPSSAALASPSWYWPGCCCGNARPWPCPLVRAGGSCCSAC